MTLKLEVGKTYLTKTGDRVTITDTRQGTRKWFVDSVGNHYTEDGIRSDVAQQLVTLAKPQDWSPDEIPYADLVRAVLDGKIVQYNEDHDSSWSDLTAMGFLDHVANPRIGYSYRLKPELVTKAEALACLEYLADDVWGSEAETLARFIQERT